MVQRKDRQKLPKGTMLCQISSKGQQQLYTQIVIELACTLFLLNLIGSPETQPQVLCCSADCLCSLRNRDTQVQQHLAALSAAIPPAGTGTTVSTDLGFRVKGSTTLTSTQKMI